jgi:hypothetical protein
MRYLILCTFLFAITPLFAQQTVGLFINDSLSYNGYTLFSPSANETTFLIDNCGEVVHTWQSAYQPGLTGYLLPDGKLVRSAKANNNINFNAGGAAGKVELFDWDGNLLWYYDYSDTNKCSNHDVQMLPNGNVLLLAFYDITEDTALALGRNPATVDGGFWEGRIIEVQPTGMGTGNIVWEWHASDHSVQDFDSTKANFGIVGANPRKININYPSNVNVDWLHVNGIDYNPELDQILLSVREFNEVWIIDHSTTTAEASSSVGGNAGRGGDLLYRWGNPAAYKRGGIGNQILYKQHDAQWVPAGYPNAGNITIYNNGQGRPAGEYSTVEMIVPPLLTDGNYTLQQGQPFGTDTAFYTYTANPPLNFYSRNISGAQGLPNGNILICEGTEGRLFEITPGNDSIVLQYVVPVNALGPVSQGLQPVSNNTFQAVRYGVDFPAFVGKNLTPQGPIELNPLPSTCQIYVADTTNTTGIFQIANFSPSIYPNPSTGNIQVNLPAGETAVMKVTSISGALVFETNLAFEVNNIIMPNTSTGMYLYQIITTSGKVASGKILIE